MRLELHQDHTRLQLSDESWNRVLRRLIVGDRTEIPFLSPILMGHHFFTGAWPPPPDAVAYEPHEIPGSLTRISDTRALWHQQETPSTHIETRIAYEIVGPGTVEMRFETRSHAASYPHGYVGLFWGTVAPHGGQRGLHVLRPGRDGARWHYFQGGGDCWSCRANTLLGPAMPSAAHSPGHPMTYFFAEAAERFRVPIQVARWRDLYYSVEVDTAEVAFTNVLMATAFGGPSWDLYWRLAPGERKTIGCRVTVGPWSGWEAVEERYRSWGQPVADWAGGSHPQISQIDADRKASSPGHLRQSAKSADDSLSEIRDRYGVRQRFRPPQPVEAPPDGGLALSEKLFAKRGRAILERLGLLDRCSVGCFGGTSQNALLDDPTSRDHWWGPYLSFLLREEDWEPHHAALEHAVEEMPDEVDGVSWIGYDGPRPRKTGVQPIPAFLRGLTGFDQRPETDLEWLPHLSRVSFLGRRWTEQLFDAGQGRAFHDPGKQFTELWRHWTGYVPPDIHRALLARSLFRVWNAGSEYNLGRAERRGDRLALTLCRERFGEEVLELAFCWNEQFVPAFKWRAAHFRRLPICPTTIQDGIEALSHGTKPEDCLKQTRAVVDSIKRLMKDLYHLDPKLEEPLAHFAHAIHDRIEDEVVKRATALEW